MLQPVGSWRVPELSRRGSDLADDSSTLGRAPRHEGSQELTKLTWVGETEAEHRSKAVSVPRFIYGPNVIQVL